MSTAAIGQRVMCSGYPGAITEVHDGQLAGMVTVRLNSGSVCVDADSLGRDCESPGCLTPATTRTPNGEWWCPAHHAQLED